jgi:hypothetical protein
MSESRTDHQHPPHGGPSGLLSHYEPQGDVDQTPRPVEAGSRRLRVMFVGGTTFVRNPANRSIEAIHPRDPHMPHYTMVIGRTTQGWRPDGSTTLPSGADYLPHLHPDLRGPSDAYWLWCPNRIRLTTNGSTDKVHKEADKLVVLRRHFQGPVVPHVSSQHADLVFHLRGGTLDDGVPVNIKSAHNFWYFEGHRVTPLVLNDVTVFDRQSDDLALTIRPLDDDADAQLVELPDGPTTLYVFHMPVKKEDGAADEIHHHLMARVLAAHSGGFRVPILISPTRGPKKENGVEIPDVCRRGVIEALAPPDSEFCVNSEL